MTHGRVVWNYTYRIGRMILNSVQNGPLVWPSVVEEDGTTRTKRYEELSVSEKLQADCDLKATNIVLQGLPLDLYAIVNHHKVAKEIWDRVKLLMFDEVLNVPVPSIDNSKEDKTIWCNKKGKERNFGATKLESHPKALAVLDQPNTS
ncbi:hypothetical protein Tco_0723659 [Tanacetum coccineum]